MKSPKKYPLISVIIPVYNQEEYIQTAIESIRRQKWPLLELIIIDDGSTDGLSSHLEGYHRQSNEGPASARNNGILKASGEFLAFLDADDSWPEGRLEWMMSIFDQNPEIEIVRGQVKEGSARKWLPLFGSVIIKKSVFSKVGLLDETLTYSEDQDWFLRAKERGVSQIDVEDVSLNRTINPKSMTFNKTWKELDIHKVLKKSLDRRRKLVSVIIAVHNGADHLHETLSSVFNQSYSAIEVITIDDGSSDESAEIIKQFPQVKYINQEQQGNSRARNRGVEEAKGSFIAFIDQDDLWHPEKLQKQMDLLARNPDVLITLSHFLSFLSPGATMPSWCRPETFVTPKVDYSPSSMVVRKEVFTRNGFFDEAFQYASDVDWFFKAKDAGLKIAVSNEVLHKRRVHEGNQSHHVVKLHGEILRVLRRSVKSKKLKNLGVK